MSDHIVSAYDDQLNLINTNLIKLGGLVESQLKNAIKSLSDKDTSLADQVVNDDNKIDDLEKEIHELIYKVIAMRQPIAIDLRTVLSAFTIAKDLERMGDHATNIAKRAADLKIYMPDSPIAEIASMASEVQLSITKVLDAYVAKSGELALEVWDKDIVIDKSYSVSDVNHRVHDGVVVRIETANHNYWTSTPAETLEDNPFFCIKEIEDDGA